MRSNPVFLEGLSLLEKKMVGRFLAVLYISVLSIQVVIFLSDAAGNILSPEFNPPNMFNFIIAFGQIGSSILLLISYSILSLRAEEILNWIKHGKLNICQVLAGRFLISLFLTLILGFISIPWFVYVARVSALPGYFAVWAIFFNGIAVLTYGHAWVLAGFLFNKNRVVQTIFIWVYIFIYLLISARIFPAVNPILMLDLLNKSLLNNLDINSIIRIILPALYINLFLLLSTFATAFILWLYKVRIDE